MGPTDTVIDPESIGEDGLIMPAPPAWYCLQENVFAIVGYSLWYYQFESLFTIIVLFILVVPMEKIFLVIKIRISVDQSGSSILGLCPICSFPKRIWRFFLHYRGPILVHLGSRSHRRLLWSRGHDSSQHTTVGGLPTLRFRWILGPSLVS